jgi:CRP-like cAMP-binding protein
MVVHASRRPHLGSREISAIAAYGAKAEWPDGFSIYQRGTAANGMFIVVSGGVVLRTIKGRRRFVPALVFGGETFGAEGLAPGARYATDAQAAEPTTTLHVDASHFRALLREQPAHALAFIAQAFAERAALLQRVHEMCAASVDERVSSALLRLFDGRSTNGDDRLVLRAADHRLLCELVGATRESITHSLARLTAAGVAGREGQAIVISRSKLLDERLTEGTVEQMVDRGVARETRAG